MTRSALFVRWVLGIVAAIFLAIGIAFMAIPSNMIGAMDIEAGSPKAMADIRAVYGGADLALGILLFICFFRKQFASGLAIGALALTCLFVGRLIGIVADGADDVLTFGLFASEVLGAVLCAVAWFLSRAPEADSAYAGAVPAAIPEERTETVVYSEPAVSEPKAPEPGAPDADKTL